MHATLFDTAPAKRRPGYANFAVAEPPQQLVLLEGEPERDCGWTTSGSSWRAPTSSAPPLMASRMRGCHARGTGNHLLLRHAGQGLGVTGPGEEPR